MPRRAETAEEKALKKQVEDLIKNIKGTDKPAVDIPRAITLFERAQKNIMEALAVLKGEEVEQPNPAKKPRKNASKTSAALLDSTGPAPDGEEASGAEVVADGEKGAHLVAGGEAAPTRQTGNPRQRR